MFFVPVIGEISQAEKAINTQCAVHPPSEEHTEAKSEPLAPI